MANPTSNFGWQMPTPTDLVTDLPADFEVFGQAVDTSMADLKGGTTDQVLAKNSNTDMDFKWVTSDDANAIQNSIVNAKGDLIGASANDTPAILSVGNNGETLVADSSATTGLSYQANFAAGKNAIINGDFFVNQRNFTTSTTSAEYNADRWRSIYTGGTTTTSIETFTPGAAPVAGYEGRKFYRMAITGQSAVGDSVRMQTSLENVTTFAGQTVTYSFFAKASSGTPKLAVEMVQSFGSGGSAGTGTLFGTVTLSTSWARYSVTGTVPSISGKTIGDGSQLSPRIYASAGSSVSAGQSIGIQNVTFDLWGLQLEAGSVATAFQTATGTIQGELAACQRYFTRIGGEIAYNFLANAYFDSATTGFGMVNYSSMRSTPAATFTTASNYAALNVGTAVTACTAISADFYNTKSFRLNFTVGSSRTAGQGLIMTSNNTTNGYIDISAEL
jgi:hypothetical protein